jgi:hypothetical protein
MSSVTQELEYYAAWRKGFDDFAPETDDASIPFTEVLTPFIEPLLKAAYRIGYRVARSKHMLDNMTEEELIAFLDVK